MITAVFLSPDGTEAAIQFDDGTMGIESHGGSRSPGVAGVTEDEIRATWRVLHPASNDQQAAQQAAPVKARHTCNGGQGPHFGRKTPGCPRCDQLLAGDAPRRPDWVEQLGKSERDAAMWQRDRQQHFGPGGPHERGDCGQVCTFGDW